MLIQIKTIQFIGVLHCIKSCKTVRPRFGTCQSAHKWHVSFAGYAFRRAELTPSRATYDFSKCHDQNTVWAADCFAQGSWVRLNVLATTCLLPLLRFAFCTPCSLKFSFMDNELLHLSVGLLAWCPKYEPLPYMLLLSFLLDFWSCILSHFWVHCEHIPDNTSLLLCCFLE